MKKSTSTACKSVDLGSTPGVASIQLNQLVRALTWCLFYLYILLKNQQNTA